MFHVLLLVCSTTFLPQDCTYETAVAALEAPPSESAAFCGIQGQIYLAATHTVERRPDEYVKIVCVHDRHSPQESRGTRPFASVSAP
jgi:hypothetical protein